jgi:murein L,D-transpeptidase YafK
VGKKECQGDLKTPEGQYRVVGRNPKSAYHLSLRLSYPNAADVAAAKAKGCPPGGDIMIHGITNGLGWMGRLRRQVDWTLGCIAVTDEEIERIWNLVPDGTPVEIRP